MLGNVILAKFVFQEFINRPDLYTGVSFVSLYLEGWHLLHDFGDLIFCAKSNKYQSKLATAQRLNMSKENASCHY